MSEPFTIQLRFVPRDCFVVTFPLAHAHFRVSPTGCDEAPNASWRHRVAALDLFPVGPLTDTIGYAAWGLIGATLYGFVQQGDAAAHVASWLERHLALMLRHVQDNRRDLVEAQAVTDRRCAEALQPRISERLPGAPRFRSPARSDAGALDIVSPTLSSITCPIE